MVLVSIDSFENVWNMKCVIADSTRVTLMYDAQDGGSASLNLPLVRLLKHSAKPKTKSFCNFVEKVEGEEKQDAKGEGLVLSV